MKLKLKYERHEHRVMLLDHALVSTSWCTGFFEWDPYYLVWLLSGYAKKPGGVILEEAP